MIKRRILFFRTASSYSRNEPSDGAILAILCAHRRPGQSPQITKRGYFNQNIIIFESVDTELNH
jgi:hypothetical protein